MIKFLKSNRIISFFVLIFIAIFISNPQLYMQSCLNGVSVWFVKVFPSLFPFFIATRMLVLLDISSIKPMDKFCNKMFRTSNSGRIFFLSIISGYPIGAKLICDSYTSGQISLNNAQKMMSYCSVSGPMFVIGSIGIGVFKSLKIGYILIISHILGAIINGVIFRNTYKNNNNGFSFNKNSLKTKSSNILADSMTDSITSILIVAGYIVFAYVCIDLLNNLNIIPFVASTISKLPFNLDKTTIISFLYGIFEMTRGLVNIGATNISAKVFIPLSSFLIGFGGISIFLQSLNFTKELKIKKPFYLFQKFCHGIWAMIVSIIICCLVKI